MSTTHLSQSEIYDLLIQARKDTGKAVTILIDEIAAEHGVPRNSVHAGYYRERMRRKGLSGQIKVYVEDVKKYIAKGVPRAEAIRMTAVKHGKAAGTIMQAVALDPELRVKRSRDLETLPPIVSEAQMPEKQMPVVREMTMRDEAEELVSQLILVRNSMDSLLDIAQSLAKRIEYLNEQLRLT